MSVSVELSPAKATKKVRSKSFEGEGTLTVTIPADGFAYFDLSFFKDMSESLLLPTNRKRLNDIGPVQSAEWSLAHAYKVSYL